MSDLEGQGTAECHSSIPPQKRAENCSTSKLATIEAATAAADVSMTTTHDVMSCDVTDGIGRHVVVGRA